MSGILKIPVFRDKIPIFRGELHSINQLDQTTQQNAAMVEQSTAAASSLSHEAAQLQQLVSIFRLDQGNLQRNGGPGGTRTPNQAVMSRRL